MQIKNVFYLDLIIYLNEKNTQTNLFQSHPYRRIQNILHFSSVKTFTTFFVGAIHKGYPHIFGTLRPIRPPFT